MSAALRCLGALTALLCGCAGRGEALGGGEVPGDDAAQSLAVVQDADDADSEEMTQRAEDPDDASIDLSAAGLRAVYIEDQRQLTLEEDGSISYHLVKEEEAVGTAALPAILPPIGPIPDDFKYYRSSYRGAAYDDVDYSVNGDVITIGISYALSDAALTEARIVFSMAEGNGSCSFTDPAAPEDAPAYLREDGAIDLTASPLLYVTDAGGDTSVYQIRTQRKEGDLPVLYVTTAEDATITREEYTTATLTLEGVSYAMRIRGRGNASWRYFPQKSYLLNLEDQVSLLGMRPSHKWVLLSTYGDASLIRNPVSMDLAAVMDHMEFTPRQLPVDLFLNGEYMGVFTFSEKIEVATGKVDLFARNDAWGEAAPTADDVTVSHEVPFFLECGGDLFETHVAGQEYFYAPYLPKMFINYPEFDTPYTDEANYIIDYIKQTGQAIVRGSGYEEYIDVDSWVDWFIVMELTNNTDSAFCRSTYLYKRPGEKLMLGPVWDFDMALGNFCDNPTYAYWATAEPIYAPAQGHYISYLYRSDDFMDAVRDRWDEVKDTLWQTGQDAIDRYGEAVAWSRTYNDRVKGAASGSAQVEYVRRIFQKRYDWIDMSLHMAGYNRHAPTLSVAGDEIIQQVQAIDENGNPLYDAAGNPVMTLIAIPRHIETVEEEAVPQQR